MGRTDRKRVKIYDEGLLISEDAESLDFTGGGISGTAIGNNVQEAVPSVASLITNSASLANLLSDETGTGFAVFSDSPVFTTRITTPKIIPSSDSTTAIQFNKADGSTNVLNIDTTNSRIGVGTTSPEALLYLKSASYANSGLKIEGLTHSVALSIDGSQNSVLNTSYRLYIQNATSTVFNTNGGSSAIGGSVPSLPRGVYITPLTGDYKGIVLRARAGQTANLFEWQADGGGELGAITASGNVGIGTTSPNSLLNVQRSTSGSLANFEGPSSGTSSFTINGGTTGILNTYLRAGNAAASNNILYFLAGGSNKWAIGLTRGNAEDLYIGDDVSSGNIQNPRLVINRASGNVGIGTTSPGGRLASKGSTSDNSALNTLLTDSSDAALFTVRNDGAFAFKGGTVGVAQTGYTTFSNLSTARTCDANATTVEELADILGTLIEDLKAKAIISA